MDKKRRVSISRIKETPYIIKITSPFDPSLPLILSCIYVQDWCSARLSDGSEKSIGYVSQTLTQAEKTLFTTRKRGPGLHFCCKTFHSYVFGHKFLMYTDNLSRSPCLMKSSRFRYKQLVEYNDGDWPWLTMNIRWPLGLLISIAMQTH